MALKDPFARLVVLGPVAAAWVEGDVRHARDVLYNIRETERRERDGKRERERPPSERGRRYRRHRNIRVRYYNILYTQYTYTLMCVRGVSEH